MKILQTIVLSLVVFFAAFVCFFASICAIGGDGSAAGNRGTYAMLDLVVIAVIVGAIILIAKLNRKIKPPL